MKQLGFYPELMCLNKVYVSWVACLVAVCVEIQALVGQTVGRKQLLSDSPKILSWR